MQILPAHNVSLVITGLTNLADELELAEMPQWHAVASAAACIEHLLHGETPTDIADVTASLKDLGIKNPGVRRCGQFTFLLIDLSITMIDAIRLGLLDIQPKLERPKIQPLWIGIDMAKPGKDTTVFRGDCHA
ncbi:MAG: hypothetical protein CVU31_02650 [Betaproteobacteria bacterium HGW-Betaproteobacteria-4]|jgi:hypothetical protein|nr:MAG: hypothetical protein CVU31_02650 [Betaproteobacteria bacterium HGW-Betaproteobacteria-4]